MSLSSDTWVTSVTKGWYGTTLSSDQFKEMWSAFLASSAVRGLPANATVDDYHRLYLQFISDRIITADPWFKQITQAAYGNSLSDAEVTQMIKYFLTLPEVLALPQPASADDYHQLYLRYIAEMILSEDPWYANATLQFYGPTTPEQTERILLDFLSSPEVLALPSTATNEDYQRLYIQYLSSERNKVYLAEAATSVSPEQVQQSKIMWSIFELLAQMITTTSISQIRSAEVIEYFTKKREEYTKLLSRIPLYTGVGGVNVDLNETLGPLGLTPLQTVTSPLINGDISHFSSSLQKCYQSWTGGLWTTTSSMKHIHLDEALLGAVSQIQAMGTNVSYYDSPSFTDGTWQDTYHKVIVIRVTKTGDNSYTAAWARRPSTSSDASLTDADFHNIGSFTTGAPQVTDTTGKRLLISSADSVFTPITVSSDPTKFYLGYGGMTLDDLTRSLYEQYAASLPDAVTGTAQAGEFTLYSGDWIGDSVVEPVFPQTNDSGQSYFRNRLVISVSRDATSQTPRVTATLYQDSIFSDNIMSIFGKGTNEQGTVDWTQPGVNTQTLQISVGNATVADPDQQEQAIIDNLNSTFLSTWNKATEDHQIQLTDASQLSSSEQASTSDLYKSYCMNARDPKISWSAGILGSAWSPPDKKGDQYQTSTLFTLQTGLRAQENQRENSYISAVNSRMEVLGNLSDQQQQVVDTAASGIKTTNNMINANIQQLMQILNSIFS